MKIAIPILAAGSAISAATVPIYLFPSQYDGCALGRTVWTMLRMMSVIFDPETFGVPISQKLTPAVWGSINGLEPSVVPDLNVDISHCPSLDEYVGTVQDIMVQLFTDGEVNRGEAIQVLTEVVEANVKLFNGEASGLSWNDLAKKYVGVASVTPASIGFTECYEPGIENSVPLDFKDYFGLKLRAGGDLCQKEQACEGCATELGLRVYRAMYAETTPEDEAMVKRVTENMMKIQHGVFEAVRAAPPPESFAEAVALKMKVMQGLDKTNVHEVVEKMIAFMAALKEEVWPIDGALPTNRPITDAFEQHFTDIGC